MPRVPHTAERAALRDAVEADALTEAGRVGAAAVNKSAVARRFDGRGASPATLFRWVSAALRAGVPGRHLKQHVEAEAVKAARVLRARSMPSVEDRRRSAVEAAAALAEAAGRILAELRAAEAQA